MKNKFFIISILIGSVFIFASLTFLYAFNKSRTIKPVSSLKDVMLTRPLGDVVKGENPVTQRFIYLAYIAGFLDAAQLEGAKTGTTSSFLKHCEGMTVAEISNKMAELYQENSQWKNEKPAYILISIIPQLRKIKSSVDKEK